MKEVSRRQGTSPSPCAACRLLRRRCADDCIFAPYFPAEEPQRFASIHKVFGAGNVSKMLQELPEDQRCDAASSMVYEANARLRDPVYGCVGAISSLQHQINVLQAQLAVAQAEMVRLGLWQKVHPLAAAGAPEITSPDPAAELISEPHAKAIFAMDLAMEQALAAVDDPMWSC